ncbi:DEAD/DEAH box helicase [Fimbriiglobus ruber]|uniref:ATP-dependent RNA helicase RhlE n=1 Tax=Fimbriiglobus ruber TaxID=1908690 RepID=A0A225D0M3_9BACT|nr:DEAD/DEAH box helicase [Fimbriiglobus ruber]OWK35141.1 ATP-dependent RNA helicase RhlE [Fimbriiglobus ruber]
MPFKSLGLDAHLVKATRDLGYTEPTPVQAEAIPAALTGRDVIATAQTGTGKTAAFLLPVLHRMINRPRGAALALVISPTRELAEQIESVCRGLSQHTPVRSVLVVGGRPMGPQDRALRAGVDIVIATPGRLMDHMQQGTVRFDRPTTLILDEADSMLDMGFLPDVRRIIARIPNREQTLLFSATMPPVIAKLASEILRNPATVQIGRRAATAVGITQAAYPVPEHLKTSLLRHMLRNTEMPSVLVFCRTKHSARRIARIVGADGFAVAELHSNRTPAQRTKAMEGFRRGEFRVMVATNIAARGLDVDHITHVISLDVPTVPEDYVHRIGRTARAGADGDAFIMVSPAEEGAFSRIERQVGQRLPRITLPDFDYSSTPPRPPSPNGRGPGPAGGSQGRRPAQPPRNAGPAKPPRPGRGTKPGFR